MNRRHTIRSLRWFFLAWLTVVYLWGLQKVSLTALLQFTSKKALTGSFCEAQSQPTSDCLSLPQYLHALDLMLPAALLFSLLLLGCGVLFWMNLSGIRDSRFSWWAFVLQCLLVAGVVLDLSWAQMTLEVEIALILILALVLEALTLLRQKQAHLVLSCLALLLFFLLLLKIVSPAQERASWFVPPQNLLTPLTFGTLFGLMALLLFALGSLSIYLQWIRSQTHLEIAYQELETTHAELTASTEQIERLTRLTERQRLARELHDTLAQGLAGLVMQLQVADSYQGEHNYERTRAILQQAILRARTALTEARQTIDDLWLPLLIDQSFTQEVQEEIERFTDLTGISCETELTTQTDLSPLVREQALRVLREGLTNVARHARANRVQVHVQVGERMLEVAIDDDGMGFDTQRQAQPGHYGLPGLHERARLMGGQCEVKSRKDAGTRLRFRVPLTKEEENHDPCADC